MQELTMYVISNGRETFYTEFHRKAVDKFEEMRATPEYGEPVYSEDVYDLDDLNEIQAAELRAVLRARRADFSGETRQRMDAAVKRHEEEVERVG